MKNRTLHPDEAKTATATHPSRTPDLLPEGRELLTQAEMARRLGISRRTLHKWVCEKAVPMIKIRGYCRFDFQRVLAALDLHEQPAAAPPDRRSPEDAAPCAAHPAA